MAETNEFDLVIKPGTIEKTYWSDIWRFRELFYILTWRDLKVRYKQTVLGVGWSIIRPLLQTIILTVIFGRIAKMPSELPVDVADKFYPILVLAGMLPWMFFSGALSETSNSIVQNANLVSKIYFPRLIVPASTVIVSVVDFLISFGLMIVLFFWYQFIPSWRMVFLPAFLLLAFIAAFGIGLLLTAVNVKYRDFRFVMPFIIQFGMYVSPVGLSSFAISQKYGETARLIYSLNPMVGVIDGFRWSILGTDSIYWPGFFLSVLVTLLFLWIGIRYFRKTEKGFADII